MKRYVLCGGDSLVDLANKVNKKSESGYEPVGGLVYDPRTGMFVQAMWYTPKISNNFGAL